MSSSKPKMPCVTPSATPTFNRRSSQFCRLRQLDESPPKLNPAYGVMNPWARAGQAARTSRVTVTDRVLIDDIRRYYQRDRERCTAGPDPNRVENRRK